MRSVHGLDHLLGDSTSSARGTGVRGAGPAAAGRGHLAGRGASSPVDGTAIEELHLDPTVNDAHLGFLARL